MSYLNEDCWRAANNIAVEVNEALHSKGIESVIETDNFHDYVIQVPTPILADYTYPAICIQDDSRSFPIIGETHVRTGILTFYFSPIIRCIPGKGDVEVSPKSILVGPRTIAELVNHIIKRHEALKALVVQEVIEKAVRDKAMEQHLQGVLVDYPDHYNDLHIEGSYFIFSRRITLSEEKLREFLMVIQEFV